MSDNTAIQWTDITDNIIVAEGGGWWCRKISDGCTHCYAAKLNQSDYFHGNKLPYSGAAPPLKLRREIIEGWARQRKSRKHFVESMSDVFGEWVPREWQFEFLDGMLAAPMQTFQVLTKRADVMLEAVTEWLALRQMPVAPSNIWFGVSVEHQPAAIDRLPILLKVPAVVRFVSAEPLLSPVNLEKALPWPDIGGDENRNPLSGLHWVIVGGESGTNARPCSTSWIRQIVGQCKEHGISVFVKQLGANSRNADSVEQREALRHSKGGEVTEWPEDLRVREFPTIAE